jgi:hypothetical protein
MSFKLINVSKFIINFHSVRKGDVMYVDAAKHFWINYILSWLHNTIPHKC